MWFRKKPKPLPWYRKVWNSWYQMILAVPTILAALGGAYQYIALDTKALLNTTQIEVVALQNTAFVKIDIQSDVRETAYLNIYVDNNLVVSHTYPQGLPVGEHIVEVDIPKTVKSRYIAVRIELVYNGIRTLFQPEDFGGKFDVERQINNSGATRSDGFVIYPKYYSV